ncbi:hypothetical protein ONS96_013945 [Cadophora gregata f. sp. sojae]|nr:hypothetical protein ONS96_013945 [Cadophora gregata f. sp. sojae]
MFKAMLCAFYVNPYCISSCSELSILTRLADFYCALPIVSRTLNMAFLSSPDLINDLPNHRCEAIELATKLRNKILFREALVWIVGPWSMPMYHTLEDTKLRKIAHKVYADIALKIVDINHKLLAVISHEVNVVKMEIEDSPVKRAMDQAMDQAITRTNRRGDFYMPRYFRELDKALRAYCIYPLEELLEDAMNGLLRNNLLLNKGTLKSGKATPVIPEEENNIDDEEIPEEVRPETRSMEDHFLCAEIEDEDLPWDVNETDF